MSRSNPTNDTPNPSTRWFEWAGGQNDGFVRYYDKEEKKNVKVDLPFQFILLDELAAVRGWHDNSESGIYSNEVRDTRQDVMVVKAFKGGELAVGRYASIRDRVKAVGGHFQTSIYIAYKKGGELRIGNLSLKGSALSSWMDFKKANRSEVFKQAIAIVDFRDGRKGGTSFRCPVFELRSLSEESNAAALELDKELQEYLKSYLSRTRDEQVQEAPAVDPYDVLTRPSREAVEEEMASQAAASDDFDTDSIPF